MTSLTDWLTTPTREAVDIPGSPSPVYVRELLAEESLSFPEEDATYYVLSCCVTDADGSQVLTPDQARALPRRIMAPLVQAANRLNGWDAESVEAAAGN